MNSEHNIQLCIQCALPVVTIMALWQLLNLGTGCTVYIYIYYESKRIRKISVTLSFTPWGDRQTVFYYGEKHTLYTIIYDITACEDIN